MIAHAASAPETDTNNEVLEGSIIKAVYLEIWLHGTGTTGTVSSFNMTLEKRPANAASMTIGQANALDAYPNKKNILYTTQGIVGPEDTQAVPMLRQWFAIPKGKQRMGFEDDIVLNIASIVTTFNVCGMFIYKEYR